jgi:periplasmic mercuric ion binding protein
MIRNAAAATLALLISSGLAQAAEKTIPLDVHHAYCELCPSIVTNALKGASGVKTVQVTKPNEAGDMRATVTFDDAVTSPAKLVAATTNAGYPAEVSKN